MVFTLMLGNVNLVFGEVTNSHLQNSYKNESVTAKSLYIDNITIQADAGSREFSLNDKDKKYLIYEITRDSKNEIINWFDTQFLWLSFITLLGVLAGGYAFIKYSVISVVASQVSNQISALNDVKDKGTETIIKVTVELDRLKVSLKEVDDLDIKLKDLKTRAEKLQIEDEQLKDRFDNAYDDLRNDLNDHIDYLMTRFDAHKKWLKAIDKSNEAANSVVEVLIAELNGIDDDARKKAADLLPYYEVKKDEIISAFEKILELEGRKPFGMNILSKLGEFDSDDRIFEILSNLCNDLTNPNFAAVIGAFGSLQENRKGDIAFIKKVVDQLITLLESLIEKQPSTIVERDEIANYKNAIALALSYSGEQGEKAVPLLIRLIEDSDENEFSKSAAIALGNIGETAVRSISALEKLLASSSLEVSSAAQAAIDKIKRAN
ncbi:MAG: HEAT repeat domain-containing protein [Nitrosomonas sp.]|nr:HEAT repeat domain-containing protein [Nitrosomonas sp.]